MGIRIAAILLLLNPFLIIKMALSQENSQNPFANGKPIGLVFADFYTGIGQGSNPSAFEIKRAYLGYEFNLGGNFSSKIQLDIGSPDDVSNYSLLRRFAYFKDAYLQYEKNGLNIKFGIIPLQQYKMQENIWAHRYIAKTILDEHGLGSSADLGASLNYVVTSILELDFTLINGEGYSNLQTDYSYKAGLGATLKPWKGLILRTYVDGITKTETQWLLVSFIGYEAKEKFMAGFEYNIKLNNKFEENHTLDALSGYASWHFAKKLQLFGRYDFLVSNRLPDEERPWNLDKDGSAIIAGIEYRPVTKVKIALDYQDWFPYANNAPNVSFIYLNLEFRVW